MTDDRSLARAARSFIEPGPTRAPEAAVERALGLIQKTQQERDLRIPWRTRPMSITARLAAATVAFAIVVVGGVLILRPGGSTVATPPSPSPSVPRTAPASVAPTISSLVPSAGLADYSTVPGRILVEHAGNAPDGSEPADGDYHIDRRRFYWMDPRTMTGATAVEFLPGQPATGKVNGDISRDQTKIVFQDGAEHERIWIANLDGTALHQLDVGCAHPECRLLDPAFDPTGSRVALVRVDRDTSVIVIVNLTESDAASGDHALSKTFIGAGADIPAKPVWSPDGKKIAFYRTSWDGDTARSARISVVDVKTSAVTILPIPLTFPGDPHWSADGSRILLTDGPLSMQAVPLGQVGRTAEAYSVAPDGSDLLLLTKTIGNVITASYTPDGRVLFFNNYFWLANADGTDPRPVNIRGDDLSELNVGFAVVGHWIDMTP